MSDADLITEVAGLYYINRLTQEDLARHFGTSRSTISRLLKQAHDAGIVEIHVRRGRTARRSSSRRCRPASG